MTVIPCCECPLSPQLALRLVGPSRLGPVYVSSCQTHRNMIELFVRASFRAPGGPVYSRGWCARFFFSPTRLHHLTLDPVSQGPFGFGYITKLPVFSRVHNIVLKIRRPGTWRSRYSRGWCACFFNSPRAFFIRLLPQPRRSLSAWAYNQTVSFQPYS